MASISKMKGNVRKTRVLEHLGISRSSCWRLENEEGEREKNRSSGQISRKKRRYIIKVAYAHPMLGYKKIHSILKKAGIDISRREVYQVLKEEGLLKGKKWRRERKRKYKESLKGLTPTQPNEVWQMDITYVKTREGIWWFLINVIDYNSRFTLATHITFSLSAKEGIKALEKAYEKARSLHQGSFEGPVTLVTDNGSTFIAKRFRDLLRRNFENFFRHIRVGYRSPEQIGVIERYNQNLKQEAIYPGEILNILHLIKTVEHYTWYYNWRRPHWALGLKTPAEVYLNKSFHEIRKLSFDSDVTGYKISMQEMNQ